MSKLHIKYTGGYKYQLKEDYIVQTDIITGKWIKTDFIELSPIGELTGKKGYAWDGASAIAIDTPSIMRPSLGHDIKYQLMRQCLIGQEWRDTADREMRKECLEDGMSRIRAWWVYYGIRSAGDTFTDPKNKKEVFTAP